MNDVLLEETAPAAGKKNKKKRGKAANNPQESAQNPGGDENFDKMAEEYNKETQA